MASPTKNNTQRVGRCGELLVQYWLLKHGVESAPMTTDYGIDLLAMHPATHNAVTIQVKTSTHKVEGSSKWVAWDKGENLIAQYIAVVDLDHDKCWFFEGTDFAHHATGRASRWLWWYVPGYRPTSTTLSRREEDFVDYKIDVVIPTLFSSLGSGSTSSP